MTTILQRSFLIESADEGTWCTKRDGFGNPLPLCDRCQKEGHHSSSDITSKVWTLEEMLREINRDWSCTDSNGNTCTDELNHREHSGCCVMAGSSEDTIDHQKNNCYQPYDVNDWKEGWYVWMGEEYNRIDCEVE